MRPRIIAVFIAVGVLGSGLTTVSAAAAPGDPCRRQVLSSIAGALDTSVIDSEPDGRYQVGFAELPTGRARLIRWVDGAVADLGSLPAAATPTAIGGDGQIVGNQPAGDAWQGWRLQAGLRTVLPTPPSFASATAEAINRVGQVAGTAVDESGWNARAVTWSSSGVARVLPSPTGYPMVTATGIDYDGTVVGTAYDWDRATATIRTQAAVRWSPAGTLDSVRPTNSEAVAITAGYTVGLLNGKPVRWNPYPHDHGPVPVAGAGPVHDINSGTAVLQGTRSDLRLVDSYYGSQQLPLDDPASGGSAVAVTNDFKVYGTDFAAGRKRPIRWTCG